MKPSHLLPLLAFFVAVCALFINFVAGVRGCFFFRAFICFENSLLYADGALGFLADFFFEDDLLGEQYDPLAAEISSAIAFASLCSSI